MIINTNTMSASSIYKFIHEMNMKDDEGIGLSYEIDVNSYIGISISNQHYGIEIDVVTEEYGIVHYLFSVNEERDANAKFFNDVSEQFLDSFLHLGVKHIDDMVMNMKDFIEKYFWKVIVCTGGKKRKWNRIGISPKIVAALKCIKNDTPFYVTYLRRSDLQTYLYGLSDTWTYSWYEEDEEMTTGIEELQNNIRNMRLFETAMNAVCIQKHFRGYLARKQYAWSPHTNLGKYYIMKEFNKLDTI